MPHVVFHIIGDDDYIVEVEEEGIPIIFRGCNVQHTLEARGGVLESEGDPSALEDTRVAYG